MKETKNYPLKEFAYVNQFQCIADKCQDQCCSVWRVSVNDEVIEKYKDEAPELYEKIEEDSSGKKFPLVDESRDCVNLKGKLCAVQGKYGSDFLPNTCYFFPRNIRKVGDDVTVSATISCPEITRLVLYSDNPFDIVDGSETRLPASIYDVKPGEVKTEDFWLVFQRFLDESLRDDLDVETIMMRLIIASKMLDDVDVEQWPAVIDKIFELVTFDDIPMPMQDFNQFDVLLYISELKQPGKVSFDTPYDDAQTIFKPYVDRYNYKTMLKIDDDILDAYHGKVGREIQRLLKRFIASELARTLFPYAWCDSYNPYDKMAVIAINFAMARLALLGKIGPNGEAPSQDQVVSSIQGIFRSQNHLTRNKVDFYREKGLLDLSMLEQVIFKL